MKILLNKRDHGEQVGWRVRGVRTTYEKLVAAETNINGPYYAASYKMHALESQVRQLLKTCKTKRLKFKLFGQDVLLDAGIRNVSSSYTIGWEGTQVKVTMSLRGPDFLRVDARSRNMIRFDSLMIPRNLHLILEDAERVLKALMTYGAVEVDADTDGRFLEVDLKGVERLNEERVAYDALVVSDMRVVVKILEAVCEAIPMSNTATKRSWFSFLSRSSK